MICHFLCLRRRILGVSGIAGAVRKNCVRQLQTLPGCGRLVCMRVEWMALRSKSASGSEPMNSKKGISMAFVPEIGLGWVLLAGMDMTDNVMLRSYKITKGFL